MRHDNEPDTHRINYTSTRLVRMREHRWIDVDDTELAAINAAAAQSPDALRACLDDLWDNAWNSGITLKAGERDDDEPLRPGDDQRVILDAVSLPDGPVDLTAAPPAPDDTEPVRDAHTEHCCAVHPDRSRGGLAL